MALNVQSLPPREFEFQMFVMDELADAADARGEDVIKLTIGVTDLPPPEPMGSEAGRRAAAPGAIAPSRRARSAGRR